MGKRGPMPRGEYQNKSAVLSTRIRADTRKHLQEAAEQSGRSLSQEIEHRLRRSFEDEGKIIAIFGGYRTYAVFRAVVAAVEATRSPYGEDGCHWLDDPHHFDLAVQTAMAVLVGFRPAGDPAQLKTDDGGLSRAEWHEFGAGSKAASLLDAIQKAPPDIPIADDGDSYARSIRLLAIIRSDLGAVADRYRVFRGNAAELRAEADRLEREAAEQEKDKTDG
ncbi:MAG: hypothetical protein AB7P12_13805 [Alphaproteobacteria bacterium]